MKVVILAGGYGTRLSEETDTIPKPLVEIGGMPILWHIMKYYASFGLNEFIVCCGYKGYKIKEYFKNLTLHASDLTIDFQSNSIKVHRSVNEPWRVTFADTGVDTMTGGRLKRIAPYLDLGEDFCMTYGDGLCDVNLLDLLEFHRKSGKIATLTAVRPPARFGALEISGNQVLNFREKPVGLNSWINGGFFVLSGEVLDLIDDDATVWELRPLEKLVEMEQLAAYCHDGFFQPMDTLRDKRFLETLWKEGKARWKNW